MNSNCSHAVRSSAFVKVWLPLTILFLSVVLLLTSGCGKGNGSDTGGSAASFSDTEEVNTVVPLLTEEQKELYLSEDNFVDPAAYGAIGDGRTDDSEALQMAIDSGYNVDLQNREYYIAEDRYLMIRNKTDFHMVGGTIHKAASADNIQLFVLKDCSRCSFSNLYIYSEFNQKDILVPKDHFRPSDTGNSNVLAFSGTDNTDILFQNNSFANMASDYWFNTTDDAFWRNITVDGWTSSSSLMPMYTQCLDGLTVRNADVSLHPGCGDGDHCIYICYRTSNVIIENSSFRGNDSEAVNGAVVTLTFHGGDERQDSQPKNILIRNCSIDTAMGRALYCEDGTDVTVEDTVIQQSTDSVNDRSDADGFTEDANEKTILGAGDASAQTSLPDPDKTMIFGTGRYTFRNCSILGIDRIFEGMEQLTLEGCSVTGASDNYLITGTDSVTAVNCTFNVNGGAALYMNERSHPVHLYENCSFRKEGATLPYLFSNRASEGEIQLKNCQVDAGGQWFSYNGSFGELSSYVLDSTKITNSLGMDRREENT